MIPVKAHADALARAAHVIRTHSKSFSLASRLLPASARDEAVVLYAWCRRADDAVDEAPDLAAAAAALTRLEAELEAVYAGRSLEDPLLQAFAALVQRRGIPRDYPAELLAGMRMDLEGARYRHLPDLLRYAYRVAGTVGLMMCHVVGVDSPAALRRAVHLGIAMQITNICRDVLEDWQRGRVYLPADMLGRAWSGSPQPLAGSPLPADAHRSLAPVVRRLLQEADRYYDSGELGLVALPWRASLAVRVAGRIYAAIGGRLAAQGYDPLRGRVYVSGPRKAWLVLRAALAELATAPTRLGRWLARLDLRPAALPVLHFPRDVPQP